MRTPAFPGRRQTFCFGFGTFVVKALDGKRQLASGDQRFRTAGGAHTEHTDQQTNGSGEPRVRHRPCGTDRTRRCVFENTRRRDSLENESFLIVLQLAASSKHSTLFNMEAVLRIPCKRTFSNSLVLSIIRVTAARMPGRRAPILH